MLDEREDIHSAFNARWIAAEDIVKTFVPNTSFRKLRQVRHSLLMGPRGCGKTTLLKMLTPPAVSRWNRHPTTKRLRKPPFTTIYVPMDIKFVAELHSAVSVVAPGEELAEAVQRALVNMSTCLSVVETFAQVLDGRESESIAVSADLVRLLRLRGRTARFGDVAAGILSWGDRLQRFVNTRDLPGLQCYLNELPDLLFTHVTNPVSRLVRVFQEHGGDEFGSWCIAFDELEIAPAWLQQELLTALRSTDQKILLKLTWSPTLPQLLKSWAPPRARADYDVIRMWYSHAEDGREFSYALMEQIVQSRCGQKISPRAVFGRSEFASHQGTDYDEWGGVAQRMRSLASKDSSFREALLKRGLNPAKPLSPRERDRNEFLRKSKPIVIIRDELLGIDGLRARKVLPVYSGEDLVCLMSDGNPRWLSLLVNELLDYLPEPFATLKEPAGPRPLISREKQARLLRSISKRMLSWMKASPRPTRSPTGLMLEDLLKMIGTSFYRQYALEPFNLDPSGSFYVDRKTTLGVLSEIERGVIEGAFLFVGGSEADVIEDVLGSRLRLSFMLSPAFRLPLRNYRSISLTKILRQEFNEDALLQRELFFDEDEEEGTGEGK